VIINPPRAFWALSAILVADGVSGNELWSQEGGATPTVSGWVVEHETRAPLEGARVTLGSAVEGRSFFETQIAGPEGTFFFVGVPPGRYEIAATLLGYTELLDTLEVRASSDLEVTLPLSVSPIPLEPVVVEVRRRPMGPLADFERRRLASTGTFFAREDIESRNPQEFTDLLRTVPGIRLVPTGTFGNRVYFRGGCTPTLWLDGAQVGSTVDIDSFLRPEDLEAVEIYSGADMPGEFGNTLCGAIVAWTRRGGPSPEGRSLKKQLIFAGSFLLLIFVTR
jgi:hypothetical protein